MHFKNIPQFCPTPISRDFGQSFCREEGLKI